MSNINLGLLSQFAVKTKAVKNMTVNEARHEVQIVSTDKADGVKSVTLRLARVILDLGALVPNCDRLDVPLESLELVEKELKKAVDTGLLDSSIAKVLERLNKEVKTEKIEVTETIEEILAETVVQPVQPSQQAPKGNAEPTPNRIFTPLSTPVPVEQASSQSQSTGGRYGTVMYNNLQAKG